LLPEKSVNNLAECLKPSTRFSHGCDYQHNPYSELLITEDLPSGSISPSSMIKNDNLDEYTEIKYQIMNKSYPISGP
jgi:hypothetical protein